MSAASTQARERALPSVRSTPVRRWTLGLAAVASFVVVLDLLVVATALTAIRRDLGASIGQLEWTINGYTLSFAVLLMPAAALGDRFGRRRGFAFGLAIAARAVQGAGAAVIMPLALALMNGSFPLERRGWAAGVYGSVTGLAALLDPVVGGAVTEGISWEWIFWLNVPIALVAIPLVLTRIEEVHGAPERIDVPGLALVSAAALGIVWALVRATAIGWASPGRRPTRGGQRARHRVRRRGAPREGPDAADAALPRPIVHRRQRRHLPPQCALTGAVFFTAQFLQAAQAHGPLAAGLRLLPWGVTPFLIAPRAGALVDRFGGRPLILIGLVLQAVGMAWMAAIADPGVSYLELAMPMTVSGIGFSIALPAVTRTVVGSVAPPDMAKASGTFTMVRQLGGAFGVAILAAAFTSAGSYATTGDFSDGYTSAMTAAAALSLAGAVAAIALAARRAGPDTVALQESA
jgi:MFS family permease